MKRHADQIALYGHLAAGPMTIAYSPNGEPGMKKHDEQLSALPVSWGGPYLWIRNAKGNLELFKVSKITEVAKDMLAALNERVSR